MLIWCSSMLAMAALCAVLHSATAIEFGDPAKTNWDTQCATDVTACILTGPGIRVTANFKDGAIDRGRLRGKNLEAWEIAPNGPKGTIVGCNGTATWEFQEMGDAFYDSTGQGKGRLYAWFASNNMAKTMNGKLRSPVVGDELLVAPPAEDSARDVSLEE